MRYAYWVSYVLTDTGEPDKTGAELVLVDCENIACKADVRKLAQALYDQSPMKGMRCGGGFTPLTWTRLPGDDKTA